MFKNCTLSIEEGNKMVDIRQDRDQNYYIVVKEIDNGRFTLSYEMMKMAVDIIELLKGEKN
jgi:uncharacterized protein YaaR (DUF327 family)